MKCLCKLGLLIVLSVVLPTAGFGYVYSDYSWSFYNGHQYAITKDYGTWAQAEAEAVALGGHLATINDVAENDWLTQFAKDTYVRGHPFEPYPAPNNLAWIGYRQQGSSWSWVSGEPVTYTSLYTGPPDWTYFTGSRAYLHGANHSASGTWNHNIYHDTNAGDNPRGIIEVTPPPSRITTTTNTLTTGDILKPTDPFSTTPSSRLKRWDGVGWQPVTAWNDHIDCSQPTVVIVHGWNDKIDGYMVTQDVYTSWTAKMAGELQKQNLAANILAWDWSDRAVSIIGQPAINPALDIYAEGLDGAAASARRGGTEQGAILANQLKNLGISNSSLQLIGHSNGGAVVGQAASVLSKNGGGLVQRVTTLDTPNLGLWEVPLADIFTAGPVLSPDKLLRGVFAMQYVHPETATQLEVYYSNGAAGRLALGFGAPLTNASNVFNGRVYPGVVCVPGVTELDHQRIPDWYSTDHGAVPNAPDFNAGIHWSILSCDPEGWQNGNYTEQGYESGVFGTTSVTEQAALNLAKRTVETFEDGTEWFGQHAAIFALDAVRYAASITSGSDGYLYKDITIPSDASSRIIHQTITPRRSTRG